MLTCSEINQRTRNHLSLPTGEGHLIGKNHIHIPGISGEGTSGTDNAVAQGITSSRE